MKFTVDKYLDREYDFTRYNCSHFVSEVWLDLTGESIIGICQAFVDGEDGEYTRRIRERIKLRTPESPCVAMIQSPRALPHAGIYLNGKILHLTENGVQFEDVNVLLTYCRISYYK